MVEKFDFNTHIKNKRVAEIWKHNVSSRWGRMSPVTFLLHNQRKNVINLTKSIAVHCFWNVKKSRKFLYLKFPPPNQACLCATLMLVFAFFLFPPIRSNSGVNSFQHQRKTYSHQRLEWAHGDQQNRIKRQTQQSIHRAKSLYLFRLVGGGLVPISGGLSTRSGVQPTNPSQGNKQLKYSHAHT